MGRSPGSYWGERVRVGWDLNHGVAQTPYRWFSQQNPIHGVQKCLISRGTLFALVVLAPVSFPVMPLDHACFRASVVTMKGAGVKMRTRMPINMKVKMVTRMVINMKMKVRTVMVISMKMKMET